MIKVAIQGGAGSYHEQALVQYYGDQVTAVYKNTFKEVFTGLKKGDVDAAVVAIANNRYGFVAEPYNELIAAGDMQEFYIVGDTYVRVEHQLLGLKGTKLQDIIEVHSQAPALGQCMQFLHESLPHVKLIEQEDTAKSAELVASWQDASKAAIASRSAGVLHGLEVLSPNIQDDTDNLTRFLVLQRLNGQKAPKDANKTTLLLETGQQPGSLLDALMPFKTEHINIATLHSAYLPNTDFQMRFYIEVNAGIQEEKLQIIINTLTRAGSKITLLGSYKANKGLQDGRRSDRSIDTNE